MVTRCASTDLEPVNGAAVDEGGELSHSVAEGISDGAESDDYVQVLSAAVHEEGKQRQRGEVRVLVFLGGLGSRTDGLTAEMEIITANSHNNTVHVLQNTHDRTSIARPSGQALGVLL